MARILLCTLKEIKAGFKRWAWSEGKTPECATVADKHKRANKFNETIIRL